MNFGEKLQRLRKAQNMSQEKLAESLSVSRQAISRWEQGTVNPDAANVVAISKLFNVSTDYLINDEILEINLENNLSFNREYLSKEVLNQESLVNKKNKKRMVCGAVILGIGLIGIVILCIFGSIKNLNYTSFNYDGSVNHYYTGVSAFLLVNNLMWLMVLFFAFFAGGIVVIFYPQISGILKKDSE